MTAPAETSSSFHRISASTVARWPRTCASRPRAAGSNGPGR
nr:MAG TPA: hypothetical protein [Caudoviricetes sp.]